MNWIDLIGYAASFFIVLSFLIKNHVTTIRIINMIGCVLFVIYGIFIENIPIILPNAFLIFVQLYYVFVHKEKNNRKL
ncbi:MAG: uroporphyrinogen decarboxylase [Capnocytophaga sp.]|nr:uroporphyrinogen decarboxylase [Capnocytophaga sp.]